jgi:hypothetical protein
MSIEHDAFDWGEPEARQRSPVFTVNTAHGEVYLHWDNTRLYEFLGGISNHIYFVDPVGEKSAIYDEPELFQTLKDMNFPLEFNPRVSIVEADNAIRKLRQEIDAVFGPPDVSS